MRFRQIAPFVVITVVMLSACSGSEENMPQSDDIKNQPPKKVWTTTLLAASDGVKRHLTGTIQAADAVSISFEVTGVISKMHVDLGQSFNKGDVLAELDNAVYLLAVQQSKSILGEATAALLDLKQTFERNKSLRQQGLISQASFDSALANFDIAEQRTEVAESSLAIAKENLSDTVLVAPYSGRVSARFAEPSQQVSPGASVISIQGNANLEVNAAIPEGLISKVALLDQVKVIVPSLSASKTYPATLTEIGAQASIANAFPITITLNDNHIGFYPGMSAEIILSVSSLFTNDRYFEVPFSAFTTDKSGPYLYFVEIQGALPTDNKTQENIANKDTPISPKSINKDTPVQTKSASLEVTAIAKKHYIEILELKPETVIIRFKQQPDSALLAESRIVKTGLDFLRPDQAISVVETSIRIYNQ
jgi:RND family efflux transporter MFP subunit